MYIYTISFNKGSCTMILYYFTFCFSSCKILALWYQRGQQMSNVRVDWSGDSGGNSQLSCFITSEISWQLNSLSLKFECKIGNLLQHQSWASKYQMSGERRKFSLISPERKKPLFFNEMNRNKFKKFHSV